MHDIENVSEETSQARPPVNDGDMSINSGWWPLCTTVQF